MAHSPKIMSNYLCAPLSPRRLNKFLKKAKEVLKPVEFDAIAFRGMSGALVAPLLAHKLNKTLIMVRKDSDNSHAMRMVEGDMNAKRYLILDDFLASGETVRTIVRAAYGFTDGEAQCVGVMLYYHHINSNDSLIVDTLCVTGTYPDGALKFDPSKVFVPLQVELKFTSYAP